MTKTLNEAERETLISLYLSEAIKNFPYPNETFFEKNREVLKIKPKSAQLNGLWQIALRAKNIDEMLRELIYKASKATLSEWRINVTNTLETHTKEMELWKFFVQSLIHIRDKNDFMKKWIILHRNRINTLLQDNGYNGIDAITLSNLQRLELARHFVHRFVNRVIIKRKIREE